MPSMSRTIQWCDGPTPRANRPPAPAWTDSAWRASAIGCCACSGTTAVPSSIRDVRAPISATMVSASKSLGTWGIHAVSKPAAPAHSMSSSSLVTLRAMSPRSAPIITPRRILFTHPLRRQLAHLVDEDIQRCAGGEDRGGTGGQQLGHVGLRDGPTHHDRDVARLRGPQRLDCSGGQRQMRTGEDRKPHQRNVFLQRNRHDVLDALPDSGVDHLETRIAQRAGDDLGAAVMAVETGLRDENTNGHQCPRFFAQALIRTPPAAGTRPTPL